MLSTPPPTPSAAGLHDQEGGPLSLEIERPWLTVACPYCAASPGDWCITWGGVQVLLPHTDRVLETR